MINLNYRNGSPLYEQIKNEYKKLIMSGVMAEGEKLPSVRSVATEMAINPNTIQKAYNELEREGYIYSVPGKGSFVSGEKIRDERKVQEITAQVVELLDELRFLGVTQREIEELVKKEGSPL